MITKSLPTEGLRFAGLIRVSTEAQGKKGESLLTQEKQIIDIVKSKKGTIFQLYKGQEHATIANERAILNQLLSDAEKDLFNAVVVCDPSRWARDNLKSKEGLEVLRHNKIRFFVGHTEYDLGDPSAILMLGMFGEFAEFQANENSKKSLLNKIERAKRGWPACGSKPFGRYLKNTNDKSGHAEWGVIEEKKEFVQNLWRLYVKEGMGFEKIEKIIGLHRSHVRVHLLEHSGDTWTQRFRDKRGAIDETIITKIPPLLTDEQIAEAKHKAKVNQCFRQTKNVYPLAHYVRCQHCGATLTGLKTHDKGKGYRYYLHRLTGRQEQCVKMVRAEWLEDAVFSHLGKILAKTDNMRAVVEQAIVKTTEQEQQIKTDIVALDKQLTELEAKKKNLIQAVLDGNLKSNWVTNDTDKLESDMNEVTQLRDAKQKALVNMNHEMSEEFYKKITKAVFSLTGLRGYATAAWPQEAQIKLARFFFGTKNRDLGVFLEVMHHKEYGRYWQYDVRGIFGIAEGGIGPDYRCRDKVDEASNGAVDHESLGELIENVADFVLPSKRWTPTKLQPPSFNMSLPSLQPSCRQSFTYFY